MAEPLKDPSDVARDDKSAANQAPTGQQQAGSGIKPPSTSSFGANNPFQKNKQDQEDQKKDPRFNVPNQEADPNRKIVPHSESGALLQDQFGNIRFSGPDADELRKNPEGGKTGFRALGPEDPRVRNDPGNAKDIPVKLRTKFNLVPGEEGYLENLSEAVVEARKRYRDLEQQINEGAGNLEQLRDDRTAAAADLEFFAQEFQKEVNRDTRR